MTIPLAVRDRHAVIDERGDLWGPPGLPWPRALAAQLPDARAAADRAAARGLTRVWSLAPRPPAWWVGVARTTTPRGADRPAAGRLDGVPGPHGEPVTVWLYDLSVPGSPWGWAGADGGTVLHAAAAYEAATGAPCGWSPAATALALMARHNRAHPAWLRYERPPDDLAVRATAPAWVRPLDAVDAAHGYIHLLDANSAYLAAAQGAALPCGPVAWLRAGVEPQPEPGAYAAALWWARPGPSARHDPRPLAGGGYYPAAALAAAAAVGQPYHTSDCHRWPEAHQALRRWAEALYAARRALDTAPSLPAAARAAAVRTLKTAYTAGLGRLAMRPDAGMSAEHYRPEWYWLIVAEQARRRWTDLARMRAAGLRPLLLVVDSLAVVSAERHPRAALGDWLRPDTLGGYKVAASVTLTAGLRRDLANPRGGAETIRRRLMEAAA